MAALDRTPEHGDWRVWVMAARPRTLPVAVAPVVVGTAVAAADGGLRGGPALAALAGALLLQIASNLANDLFDHERGADTDARIGPARVTQLGLLDPARMRRGIAVVLLLALAVGGYLAAEAGWPVVVTGLVAIGAALAYTGGPWPFGYKGLGDLAVFVFFGVVAVVGTCYVQTLQFSGGALAASVAVGCLATAILVVNNVRDIDTDRAAGKMTLAVRLGPRWGRREYYALIGAAYAALPAYWLGAGRSPWVLLPLLTLPLAVPLLRTVAGRSDGPALNRALAGTARLTLVFSSLLALGWVM